ncbi:MAG: hypothetical protein M0D53_01560 [Flavobacterium sp. JAD_PAG50586_2]|nr:MAG: hypothetical protein M0D53_01560 [Flavobacterium sp. JAD_PAG50586_2]
MMFLQEVNALHITMLILGMVLILAGEFLTEKKEIVLSEMTCIIFIVSV